MTKISLRARLLGGTVSAILATTILPQQASAQCVIISSNRICTGTQTTTDGSSLTDPTVRNLQYGSNGDSPLDSVATGALVDGFGMASVDTQLGTNPYLLTNDGTIQVNVGNTPTAGGNNAAVHLRSTNGPISYAGAGDIFNFGTGFGLDIRTSGAIDIDVGGTIGSTTSRAINAIGGGGLVDITTTAGETLWATSEAIYAQNAGTGNIIIRSNADMTSAPGAPGTLDQGIYAVLSGGTGNIGLTVHGDVGAAGDVAEFAGVEARILTPGSTGTITMTGTASIFSTTDAIRLEHTGDGDIGLQFVGSVDSATANGINIRSNNGDIGIVVGGGTIDAGVSGIDARALGTGAVSIQTGAGAVTGDANGIVGSVVDNTLEITTSSGAVTGGAFGIQAVSAGVAPALQTVNVLGVVSGTSNSGVRSLSATDREVNVFATGVVTGGTQAIEFVNGGLSTVNNEGRIASASTDLAIRGGLGATTIVNNDVNGILFGRMALDSGNDIFNNRSIWTTQGATNFSDGTDAMTNFAGATINVAGNTSLLNLESLTQSGRINLNNFTLTGSAIAFVNGTTGVIDTSGSAGILGFTTMSNAGILDLAVGTFTAPAGAFTNSGTILTDEGASTITGQSGFTNTSTGVIDLQDGAVGDTLTINSAYAGTAGGTLLVDVGATTADQLITGAASGSTTVNVNGVIANLSAPDILVVDTSSSTAGAFVLGTVTGATSPLIAYDLLQVGTDYFLTTSPTTAVFQPLGAAVVANDFWYQSADEVLARTRMPNDIDGPSFWGQVYVSRDKFDSDGSVSIGGIDYAYDNDTRTKRYGLQAGVDFGVGGARLGITTGYAWANASGLVDFDLNGWNIGAYAMVGGERGFHGELLVKHDRYSIEFEDGVFAGNAPRARSTGIDAALGYRFGFSDDGSIDVNAGLSHVWTKIQDIEGFGFRYDYDKFSSTRGRAGLRANFGGGLSPFVDATVYHEFDDDNGLTVYDAVNAYDLEVEGRGTWVRLEAGIGGSPSSKPLFAIWGDVGDRKAIGARLGFRFGGSRDVAPPPPPPPLSLPPPPPPATQTCPDGSVILATESCPPPPPPPPEPERG